MDETAEILSPDTDVKLTTGHTVTVRELSWNKAKRVLGWLAPAFEQCFNVAADGGAVAFNLSGLLPVLTVLTTDIAEELILAATDLTPEELGELYPTDVLRLLTAAVELNLTKQLLAEGNAVAGRLRPLLNTAQRSAKSITPSSAPATASPS